MIRSIISLIVIALSVAFALFQSKPMYDRGQKSLQDFQVINDTFADVGQIRELITRTSQTLGSIDQTTLARFDAFLPETIDPIRLANNLKHVGTANKLAITDIKVDEKINTLSQGASISGAEGTLERVFSLNRDPQSGAGGSASSADTTKKYHATKASFKVVATYPGFMLLLNDLEKSLGLMNITSLTFREYASTGTPTKTSAKNPISVMYEYEVELETYSLK